MDMVVQTFSKVKVSTWIDDKEEAEFVGVGARFGPTLESKEKNADKSRINLADPRDCCIKPKNKLTGEIILVHRGNCSFTTKENVAEVAGASSILIINNRTDEPDVDIGIPVVMLPQDAGQSIKESLQKNLNECLLYITEDAEAEPGLLKYREMGPDGALRVSVKSEDGINEQVVQHHQIQFYALLSIKITVVL